jgi:endonuclease/exonuclease/phosphatase family metal-dependent hydrolase
LLLNFITGNEECQEKLTYNIDTNILRTEEGPARDAFPEWRANERAPFIKQNLEKIIAKQHPDIIQIQEARKFVTKFGDQVDAVTYLVDFFREQGYEVLVQPYNQTGDKTFQFITAYNPQQFKLESTAVKYFTKTPDSPTPRPSLDGQSAEDAQAITTQIKEHNFGALFERGVFITGLQDLETGNNVYAMNVHLDIPLNVRMESSKLLASFVKEIVAKDPQANVLISGDFNSFPEQQGEEQIRILNEAVLEGESIPLLEESTQVLPLDGEDVVVDFSFIAFPYDFAANDRRLQDESKRLTALPPGERRGETINTYDRECQSLGGKLDHMFFSRGLKATRTALIPALTTDERPDSYQEKDVKDYVVRMARKDIPAFASDHQPICSTFEYRR